MKQPKTKIKKSFAIGLPNTSSTTEWLEKLRKKSGIKVPKKAIGLVVCRSWINNITITTISFCSHLDEWNENVGKRIASERLYNVINKLENK